MRVLPVTSRGAVSFRRVAEDVGATLRELGFDVLDPLLQPDAAALAELGFDATYIVMAFDVVWSVPFFYLAYRAKADGRRYAFYTTVEGRVERVGHEGWVFRELEFVAASNYVASRLREAGARVREVVYHGVDVAEAAAAAALRRRVRGELGLGEGDFAVGYLASARARKGHRLFAEAIRRAAQRDPSVKFVVVTEPDAAKLYAGLERALVLPAFGRMDRRWVFGFYHALDLYAHPALAEGFGLPALEAMACGKPVVHADYAPLSEVTTPETSFRVPVTGVEYAHDEFHLRGGISYEHHLYSPADFADAVLEAKEEVGRRRGELAEACVKRASEFERSKVYRRIADVLKG